MFGTRGGIAGLVAFFAGFLAARLGGRGRWGCGGRLFLVLLSRSVLLVGLSTVVLVATFLLLFVLVVLLVMIVLCVTSSCPFLLLWSPPFFFTGISLFDLENGTIVQPFRPSRDCENDLPSGALPTVYSN